MKKLIVLFIFCLTCPAFAQKPTVKANYNGTSAEAKLSTKTTQYIFDLSDKGKVTGFKLKFWYQKIQLDYNAYYSYGKAHTLLYSVWIGSQFFSETYTIYNAKKLIDTYTALKNRLVKKHDLKKLAIKACKKKKAEYYRKLRERKERAKKRKLRMPDPQKVLEKILNP